MRLTEQEKSVLKEYLNKRAFDTLVQILNKRKEEYIKRWQCNLDEQISANLRGRVCEDDELLVILEEINK